MHRCWLGEINPLLLGTMVTLSAEESNHVVRVLRMKPGESVQLIAAERLYAGELTLADDKAATVRVLREMPSPESAVCITLVQGLPKLDKLELIVQKATELGVWAILPVEMERSVSRLDGKEAKKGERWNRIAQEAAKQSGRAHVPVVLPALKFQAAVDALRVEAYDAIWVAWEEEGDLRLSEAVRFSLAKQPQLRSVAIVIGPEGGISPREIEQLQSIGAVCVTLGRRILRTETAGLCALAVVMSTLGEL